MRCLAPLVLGFFMLVGCDKPPVSEGPWRVSLDSTKDNTCPLTDDDLGVGQAVTGTVELSDDEGQFTFTPDDSDADDSTFDIDIDSFSRQYSTKTEVQAPCYLRGDYDYNGTIVSDSFMSATNALDLSTEGDCADVDTTGLPCSVTFNVSWTYVGD